MDRRGFDVGTASGPFAKALILVDKITTTDDERVPSKELGKQNWILRS